MSDVGGVGTAMNTLINNLAKRSELGVIIAGLIAMSTILIKMLKYFQIGDYSTNSTKY